MSFQLRYSDGSLQNNDFKFKTLGVPTLSPVLSNPGTVDKIVEELQPDVPVVCVRPHVLHHTADVFLKKWTAHFKGAVLYAVKVNPEPIVLQSLWDGGIRHFDCASIGEIEQIRSMFPEGHIHFMHPVKPLYAIREAYSKHHVTNFSLDSEEELIKIRAACGEDAENLGLFLRILLPHPDTYGLGAGVGYTMVGKFGSNFENSIILLQKMRPLCKRLGICFHVGSQCMLPELYSKALDYTRKILNKAGIKLDVINVGGGFCTSYPGMIPPNADTYLDTLQRSIEEFTEADGSRPEVWCEPGRGLCGDSISVLVRVWQRRNQYLYLNEGKYGLLADGGMSNWRYPCRLVGSAESDTQSDFIFYGPTCDSGDMMPGPFTISSKVKTGDWIEVGQLGAYSTCLRTGFNCYDSAMIALVTDPPLLVTPGFEM